MTIVNIFDAIRDGTFEEFKNYYDGNINFVNERIGLNLLQFALVNDKNPNDKIEIIKFLLDEGININFLDLKDKRNALHVFYFNVLRPTPEYFMEVTKLLVERGVNLNAQDKYGAIPLKYAITLTKLQTRDIRDVYWYLIQYGSDFRYKDKFGKSCMDYAEEYIWRNDVLEMMRSNADENK